MPEISSASELVFNSANASSAFYGNNRVWRSPIYVKNNQAELVPTVAYQSNFTGDDLAGAGLYSGGGANGSWTLNTANDYVTGIQTAGNPRAGLYSTNTWSNPNGFTLKVTWRNTAAMVRFSVGLIISSYATTGGFDPFNQGAAGAYGIGFSTAGELAGNLIFANGTTLTSLSTAQGNETIGVTQTLELTVTDGGWSYSLNGATPTTGSLTFTITNRSYRFVAWAQNLPNSTISNVEITGLPIWGDGRENVGMAPGGQLLVITPDGYLRSIGSSGGSGEGVVPTAYRGKNLVKRVWCGPNQSYLLTQDNLLIGWGQAFGALNNMPTALKTPPGNNLRHFFPLSGSHAIAVKSDGRAIVWTDTPSSIPHMSVINAGGAATSGTGNWTNLKKITGTGGQTLLGLRMDGSIVGSFAFSGTHPTTGIKDIFAYSYKALLALDNAGNLHVVSRYALDNTVYPTSGITGFWSNVWGNAYYYRQNGELFGTDARGGGTNRFPIAVTSAGSSVTQFYGQEYWACAPVPRDARKSELVFWGSIRNGVDVQNTGIEDDGSAPRDIYTYWSPYEINTRIWLDPTDRRLLSFNGNYKLITASDKKATGTAFTQGTDANRPQSSTQFLSLIPNAMINLNRGIWFDTSSKILNSQVNSVPRNIFNLDAGTVYTQESIFAVIRKNQDTTFGASLLQETAVAGRNIFWDPLNRLFIDFGTNADNTQINRLVVNNFFSGSYPSLFILSITLNTAPTGANPGFSVWVNGTLKATGAALAGAVCKAGGVTALGNNGGGAFLNGTLGELIMLDYIPSEDIRQKFEGYLAWKFQIASSLPSDHPFKDYQPLRT